MSLPEIRTAIVDALSAAGLGDHVQAHPGRLSVEELKRMAVRGRAAIRVGCLGIPKIESSPVGPQLELSWAVYIIAVDPRDTQRDENVMLIAQAVAALVAGQTWGRDDIDQPQAIRGDNLYSGKLDKRDVCLWAVTWRQIWTAELPQPGTLDDLLRVDAAWDIDTAQDGEPTPTDTIELEGGTP